MHVFSVPSRPLASWSALLLGLFVLAGCDAFTNQSSPQAPSFEVTNDLDRRITSLDDSSTTAVRTSAAKDFSVRSLARVSTPTVNGTPTTASYLSFNGNGGDRVFVGYKIRGEGFGGGIDVLNAANPRNLNAINSLQSNNLDVQEVVDDPDDGAEYVAGALATNPGDVSPAVVAKLSFSGNSGNNITVSHRRLSANVAKSVVNAPASDSEHDLYVVTDGNSLYRFDTNLQNQSRQTVSGVEFSSLTALPSQIALLTKTGGLWTAGVSPASDPAEASISLDGSDIDPLGIARMETSRHESSSAPFVFAALNEGGFRVLNESMDTVLFSRTGGHYTSVSATPESDYLYASRKDGTVEVYAFDASGGPSWSADPIATINTAEYGEVTGDTQANQVLAVGDYLYVANSRSGLLVLEVNGGGRGGGPPGR